MWYSEEGTQQYMQREGLSAAAGPLAGGVCTTCQAVNGLGQWVNATLESLCHSSACLFTVGIYSVIR
jgi:hypothetical protein